MSRIYTTAQEKENQNKCNITYFSEKANTMNINDIQLLKVLDVKRRRIFERGEFTKKF